VPEIPTALVWLGRVHVDDPVFADLANDAHRIILDSEYTSIGSLLHVCSWARKQANRPQVADLAWVRLASWQELLARFFDPPDVRHLANKVTKVRLFYDKYAGGPNGSVGSWVLGSPAGGGVGHMPSQAGIGTITLVDNTTQHPPDPGDTCETTTPKSDCGTLPLLGPPLVGVTGDGKRRLVADLARVDFGRRGGAGRAVKCSIGQARTFNDIFYSGRANGGKLAIPMASVSAVNHRRVVRVVGSSHKVSGTTECARGDVCTDDVTRKVTVTFKRL